MLLWWTPRTGVPSLLSQVVGYWSSLLYKIKPCAVSAYWRLPEGKGCPLKFHYGHNNAMSAGIGIDLESVEAIGSQFEIVSMKRDSVHHFPKWRRRQHIPVRSKPSWLSMLSEYLERSLYLSAMQYFCMANNVSIFIFLKR